MRPATLLPILTLSGTSIASAHGPERGDRIDDRLDRRGNGFDHFFDRRRGG